MITNDYGDFIRGDLGTSFGGNKLGGLAFLTNIVSMTKNGKAILTLSNIDKGDIKKIVFGVSKGYVYMEIYTKVGGYKSQNFYPEDIEKILKMIGRTCQFELYFDY